MNNITLHGHDGSKKWLKFVEGNTYKLEGELTEYTRICYGDNDEIIFADPSGGPMLSVGDKVNDKTIIKITTGKNGILIELI